MSAAAVFHCAPFLTPGQGFLAVRGSGYRKGRRGNPLPNVYRQWCDARGRACIVIEQDAAGGGEDVVVADLSPLRTTQLAQVRAAEPPPLLAAVQCRRLRRRRACFRALSGLLAAAARCGAPQAVRACCSLADVVGAQQLTPAQRPLDAVPFNTLPLASLPYAPAQVRCARARARACVHAAARLAPPPCTGAACCCCHCPLQLLYPGAAGPGSAAAGAAAPPTPEAIAAAEGAVLRQADAVRQLKEGGLSNSDAQVQQQVQVSG